MIKYKGKTYWLSRLCIRNNCVALLSAPLLHYIIWKECRGVLPVKCCSASNTKYYVGCVTRGKEVKLFCTITSGFSWPAPGRDEVLVVLVMLKYHLQSSKVGVKNLLSFSISSWLNNV